MIMIITIVIVTCRRAVFGSSGMWCLTINIVIIMMIIIMIITCINKHSNLCYNNNIVIMIIMIVKLKVKHIIIKHHILKHHIPELPMFFHAAPAKRALSPAGT